MVSLCGCHLLGDRLLCALVSGSFEALAVERVEVDAVGLVGDQEIEHGPAEREAAGLARGSGPSLWFRRLTSPSERSSSGSSSSSESFDSAAAGTACCIASSSSLSSHRLTAQIAADRLLTDADHFPICRCDIPSAANSAARRDAAKRGASCSARSAPAPRVAD
jgi:hypothetical protein